MCPSSLCKTNSYLICGQASMLNLGIKIKVLFKWPNQKKAVSFHFSIFIMIQNKKIQFQWHPHIGEIHTKILVYQKGRVIKNIKAPARVNVELPDLWKNRMVWQCGIAIFVKKFFSYVIVILKIARVTRFGISLWQSDKLLYKKYYSTSSRTFVITRESEDEQKPVLVSARPPQKSAENKPSWKLEYLSPQTWYIASQGGIWKIFAIHILFIK